MDPERWRCPWTTLTYSTTCIDSRPGSRACLVEITGVQPGSLLAVEGEPSPQVPSDVAEVLELMGRMDNGRRKTALTVLQALADES